ncbi:integrase core domain-containing protein, partial [Aeromonas caviae]|uniref:integrase core domain-containing protein n=1 Tax=Aeromonas caviae TaxID=648 RepID=UPI001FBAF2C3
TTWYESVEQMQTDLDSYLEHYNTQRPHQGRMMEGQTPAFFKIVVAQSCFKQPLFAPARVSRAAPDLASRHR